jgi:anti-anti-sigma factor
MLVDNAPSIDWFPVWYSTRVMSGAWSEMFGIHELPLRGGGVRLALVGELDLATAPRLEERLAQLREEGQPVLLDLSRLEFIDSSGLRVVIRAFEHGHAEGSPLEIDPDIAPQAMQLFKLVGVERMIVGEDQALR